MPDPIPRPAPGTKRAVVTEGGDATHFFKAGTIVTVRDEEPWFPGPGRFVAYDPVEEMVQELNAEDTVEYCEV